MLQALRFTFVIFLISGILYPLLITSLGQTLFPKQANGSFITNQRGVMIGSRLVGQNFTRPEYFHPRPSANGYDAANSGGSNYGATNKKLIDRIQADTLVYQHDNPTSKQVPMDAVTTSASGLDPDISVSNALAQVARVARARHLKSETVRQLVMSHKEQDLFTERPYVNVLRLNMILDTLAENS